MQKMSTKKIKKLTKPKKLTQKQIEKKLWQECRRISDLRYTKNGITRCFTCDRIIEGSNKQLGHLIPKGACGANLKYDLRNLRWQCYHCNINMGGQGAEFYKRLVIEKGQEYVDELFRDKNKTIKAYDYYLNLLDLYVNEL